MSSLWIQERAQLRIEHGRRRDRPSGASCEWLPDEHREMLDESEDFWGCPKADYRIVTVSHQETEYAAPTPSVAREFWRLAEEWREGTAGISSITKLVLHPSYQRIIGLGPDVVPWLLRDLERDPDHWSPALTAITGAAPVSKEDAGNLQAMARAWIAWGRSRGLVT